jgi:hypothetical protein
VTIEDTAGLLSISPVYLSPNHTIKQEQEDFYKPLGIGSLQEKTTMLKMLIRDPDLSHPEDAKY